MDERAQDLANGLRGRYTIERQLGHGGMATVWLARDLRYDRLVALKVLRPELAASLGGDRFLREIMLAARLQHPHVVSVYDSGEIPTAPPGDPILWFTMPYIEGESLRERLRRVGALPREDALRIARDVSRGLHYAHQHGVVHRDVKPENILLTADGSTLVADFGIARPTDAQPAELTGTGIVIGTPAYMSPEQASGVGDLDARTDLYALACVVYEMLTGVPPFTGATVHAIVAKHLTEQPSLSGGVAGPIPESIRPVLARALAKAPRDRQASVAEFAAALGVADRRPRAAPARTALVATAALIAAAGDRAVPRAGRCGRLTRQERRPRCPGARSPRGSRASWRSSASARGSRNGRRGRRTGRRWRTSRKSMDSASSSPALPREARSASSPAGLGITSCRPGRPTGLDSPSCTAPAAPASWSLRRWTARTSRAASSGRWTSRPDRRRSCSTTASIRPGRPTASGWRSMRRSPADSAYGSPISAAGIRGR